MIKCLVIVKTNNETFRYSGLFQSTWAAMMDAAARFVEAGRVISVRAIK